MLNLWVVGLLVVVLLRDSLGEAVGGGAATLSTADGADAAWQGGWWVWVAGSVPLLAVALLVQLVMSAAGRTVDRSGSVRAILVAERTLLAGRALTLLVHAGNVFVLGWLTEARRLLGDVVLLDELLCVLPGLAVIAMGWWSAYPVERRIREATLIRHIDQGRPVYPVPSRWRYVGMAARHQLSLSLIPIALISAWGEASDRVLRRLASSAAPSRAAEWLADPTNAGTARVALQLAGVAAVLVVAPLIVRLMWDTVPLDRGPLRGRLSAMCARHGVRVREILVWRTGGSMINGAVVGMFGRLRYVLLTDALLDAMPRPQVEAVMAHEVAHARCAHMPWLAGVLIATVGCTAAAGGLAATAVWDAMVAGGIVETTVEAVRVGRAGVERIEVPASSTGVMALMGLEAIVTIGALVAGLLVFGLVSRRFEWQADAFAAKALSLQPARPNVLRVTAEPREPSLTESPDQASIAEAYAAGSNDAPLATDPPDLPGRSGQGRGVPDELTGPTDTPDVADVPIEPIVHRAAVDAMAGALQSVAALNFIPRHRRSFRHGSIAQRQQHLRALVGQPVDRLPIDRTVRWIKRCAAVALAMLVALLVWGAAL